MNGSRRQSAERYTFDFTNNRFPAWFRPEESTRQAAVVSYMHAHQLSLTRVYAKAGCVRHFCTYRFTTYDDPAAVPGPVSSCGWISPTATDPGCRLPKGFVFRPGRETPILQAAFDRTPDRAAPIGRDPVPSPRFAGGVGTAEDPYRISTAKELLLLSYLSNHRVCSGIDPTLAEEIGGNFPEWSSGKHFRLTRDIVWNAPDADPADAVPFPMIGNRNGDYGRGAYFRGTLDGAGHFIRGLFVSQTEEEKRYPGEYNYNCGVALIGYLHGAVRNLAITDSVFSGSSRVAAVAGTLASGGEIENCLSDNRILLNGTTGDRNAGGLVGFSVNGKIARSVVGGEIVGSIYSNVCFLGGLLGAVATGTSVSTSISDCFVFASVREQIDPTVRRDYPAFLALHNEKRVEIIRITEGVLNLQIQDKRYVGMPGAIYIINPYEFVQTFVSPSDAARTSVSFFSFFLPQYAGREEESLLYPLFTDIQGRPCFSNEIRPDDPGMPAIEAALDALFSSDEKTNARPSSSVSPEIMDELRLRAGLWRFVFEAAKHGLMSLSVDQKEQKSAQFRADLIGYIEENYRNNVTTEAAARAFYLSKSYFCRRFRQEFGLPFAIYLQNFRIRKSKQLDPAQFQSLASLAASVGFPSYYHFERVFRKWMGMTPRAYFDAVRKAGEAAIPDDDLIEK